MDKSGKEVGGIACSETIHSQRKPFTYCAVAVHYHAPAIQLNININCTCGLGPNSFVLATATDRAMPRLQIAPEAAKIIIDNGWSDVIKEASVLSLKLIAPSQSLAHHARLHTHTQI